MKFHLEVGDVIITKDSESWDDIAIPAYVEATADDFICGYHLAFIRPDDKFLVLKTERVWFAMITLPL